MSKIHINGDDNLTLFKAKAVLYHPDKDRKYTVTVRAESIQQAKYKLAFGNYSDLDGLMVVDYSTVTLSE